MLLPPVSLALGLGVLAAAPTADKAEKPDAAAVAKLVAQLGASEFDDREKATAELDALGGPALDALRQAARSEDPEVARRAEILVRKIEKRLESVTALAAKRVHLVFKETPVKDAVEDFKKKTGYDIVLSDPDGKLKDRTVTLDTGDVTFWQAFGAFCEKAGLREGDVSDLVSVAPPYPGGATAEPTVAVDRITLLDGKPEGGPTADATALRLRTLPPPAGVAAADDLPVALLLSLEPRLRWLKIENATIVKAVDDQGQELIQTTTDVTPPNPTALPPVILVGPNDFIGGGIYRKAVIRLKKGPKPARSISELRGAVTAKLLGEMSAVIAAPDILTAGGKTFEGGEDGRLRVNNVSKTDDGRLTIRVELQPPGGYVPPNGLGVPAGVATGKAAAPDGLFMGPGFGWGSNNDNGLGLMDDKGNNIAYVGGELQVRGENTPTGKINRVYHVLIFQPEKGQKPSKLVFCGRKILSVEIPFTLKDVPLP
jgi:hypothetical protein